MEMGNTFSVKRGDLIKTELPKQGIVNLVVDEVMEEESCLYALDSDGMDYCIMFDEILDVINNNLLS